MTKPGVGGRSSAPHNSAEQGGAFFKAKVDHTRFIARLRGRV